MNILHYCLSTLFLTFLDVTTVAFTGNDICQSIAEVAGTTFFSMVPPITDGYVITAVRSRYYQMDNCILTAKVLCVYETDSPEVESITFDLIGENDYNINVTLTDATDTIAAEIQLNALIEVKINDNLVTYFSRTLTDENDDNVFEYVFIDLPVANYSIDIETQDAFWNEITYEGITHFCNLDPNNAKIQIITIIYLSVLSFSFIVVIVNKKRKRTY